jgi:hypothetical protein
MQNMIEEIIKKIDLYLENQIKIEDIPFIQDILENKTPQNFLEIWGTN